MERARRERAIGRGGETEGGVSCEGEERGETRDAAREIGGRGR